MCRFPTPVLFALSVLLLAPSAEINAQPVRGRINTETRQVTMMRRQEQALIDALGNNDATALGGMLANDFVQYSMSQQMLLTPRTDWLRNLAAHPFGKAHIEHVSAIDHGTTLVTNFELVSGDDKGMKRYGVVDVWTKPQDANDWVLSQRYISAPGTNPQAPGDNAPDTAAPAKHI